MSISGAAVNDRTSQDQGTDTELLLAQIAPDDPPSGATAVTEAETAAEREGVIRSGKLAGKSMGAAIWIVAAPVFVQQLMQACVGMVDKMLAGRLPDGLATPGLDAVGVGSYVGWFTGIALAGLGIGGQAIISRAIGMGDREQSHRALGQSMTLSVIWGGLVGVVLWMLAAPVARLCGLQGESAIMCRQYVFWIGAAMPFTGIMQVGAMCLHGAGETVRPSWIALWVNIVNIVFSWALSGVDVSINGRVYENPFSYDMHVAGIATGTAISSLAGALMTLWVLGRGVKDLRLEWRHTPLDRAMVKRVVRLGVPNFMEGISMWGVNLFVLMFIGRIAIGEAQPNGLQGAHIVAVQWEAFSFLPGFAIGIAAGALAGQYLGAGNQRLATRAVMTCTLLAAALMGALGVAFILWGEWLTTLVSSEPVHLAHVPRLLAICGAVQVFFAVAIVVRQGLRGAGDAIWTLVITTASSYGVRLPLAYLLGVHFGLGIEGIWYGLCGELCVRAVLFAIRFLHGGWRQLKV